MGIHPTHPMTCFKTAFLSADILCLFPHFLRQLFSCADVFDPKLLYFNFYIHFFFSFNKIFAVTGSRKSNAPSHKNPGNRTTFQTVARPSRVSVLRQELRLADRFLPACSHLEKLSSRLPCKTYFKISYGLLYLVYKSGFLHSHVDS